MNVITDLGQHFTGRGNELWCIYLGKEYEDDRDEFLNNGFESKLNYKYFSPFIFMFLIYRI